MNSPIAVIGIGCRFPGGASSPAAFWQFLCDRGNGIREIPADRWNLATFYDEDPEAIARSTTKWGGFLDDIRGFDPGFFDISPREARTMDPQQRLMLQIAYEALQDANIPAARLASLPTGVFIGVSTSDYASLQKYQRTNKEIYAGTGSALSIVSNRIAHRLNLHGPAYSVDTACSSSLVALDQACRNLHLGTCEVALAGGVNILTDPSAFIAFSKANMLSPTGRLSTFDSRANGYVRGEGAGVVVLKPLERALQDGDRIYAVIRATGVNQDGRTVTLTSPNPEAQTTLLRQVCRAAALDPTQIGYAEAHGTGTPVGDPTEAAAIGRVFGQTERDAPMLIGSVKPNIGHLESAAGISGFIKTVLSVHHGMVPPNRNFESPNPDIPLDSLNLQIPTSMLPFAGPDGIRRAVVNSFGFGGTNACALIESIVARPTSSNGDAFEIPGDTCPVPLSAADTTALQAYAGLLADQLRADGSPTDSSVTRIASAQAGFRDHLDERAVVLAHSSADLSAKLDVLRRGEAWPTASRDEIPLIVRGRATNQRKLAFTFAGQGGQWWCMGRRLLLEDPVYRRTIDAFDEIFRRVSGWSVIDAMLASEHDSRVDQAAVTQPTIFAVQIGLAELWKHRGIRPDVVIGHSFGEVAAAYTAGALDLETAAVLIHKRGLIKDQAATPGAMAVVGLPADQLSRFLPADGSVEIAAFNGPAMATISGSVEGVQRTLASIEGHDPNIFTRYLKMDFAWHSHALEPVEHWFRDAVGDIQWHEPQVPMISTVSGIPETVFDTDYWWRNLRQPVCYADAIECAIDLDVDTFLELGPHRTLSGLTTGIAQTRGHTPLVVTSLQREQDDFTCMAHALASLYVAGHAVDWTTWLPAVQPGSVTLPQYPWTNQPLWAESEEAHRLLFDAPVHPLLGQREPGPAPAWSNEINLKAYHYLADHKVDDQTVFPGAGYIEMLLAAARDNFGEGGIELENIRFPNALSIDPEDDVQLRTELDPDRGLIRIHSRKRDQETDWTLRAVARARQRELPRIGVEPPQAADRPSVESAPFYTLAQRHGLMYGPAFQGVRAVWLEDRTSGSAMITCPATLDDTKRRHYLVHPALLDAGFQTPIPAMDVMAGLWAPSVDGESTAQQSTPLPLMLPVEIRRVRYYSPAPPEFRLHYSLHVQEQEQSASFNFFDAEGTPFLSIEGFTMRELGTDRSSAPARTKAACFYQERLVPMAPPAIAGAPDTAPGRYLLLTGTGMDPLRAALEQHGATVVSFDGNMLEPDTVKRLRELIAHLAREDAGLQGIIWSAASPPMDLEEGSTEEILRYVEENTLASIHLGQVLDKLRDLPRRPGFWLLTREARVAPEDQRISAAGLTQSAVIGLKRVLDSELSEFSGTQIDADAAAFADGSVIATAILADGDETELLIRDNVLWAPRLEPRKIDDLPVKRITFHEAEGKNFLVTMSAPGVIDRLVLREIAIPRLQPDEVLLRVHAVGLNFRDIMAVTALLPEKAEPEPAWQNLGLEFGAVVESIGASVTRFKPGDRVMGMGKRCLQRYMAIPADRLVTIPDSINLEAAATIPSAFVTAHYALNHVARLQAGEKVLIHLATGGVGLAAIQLAQRAGAEIFATAGNETKRAYLRDLGIHHVMSSRSLDFADQILSATEGRGVDVILNALPGASIEKGLDCLAPYGRFLEIGKRDVYADSSIGLKALRRNGSFSVIDLASMGHDRPQLMAQLFGELVELFQQGQLEPIPVTKFAVSRIADAVRYMSQAQHIGKIIVHVAEPEVTVEVDPTRHLELDRQGTYLITGGSRGVGVAVARWLSERGAGRLVLASRRGCLEEPAAGEFITANDTELEAIALDITDPQAVESLIKRLAGEAKPLRGIIHGAAVIEDGLLHQLDPEKVHRVLHPKVAGAWNLHKAVQRTGLSLDFFVSFSSMAATLGSLGQANYVAANSFLEAFSHFRVDRQLAAGTIAWGALGDTGFVARNEAMISYLESSGFGLIPIEQVNDTLGKFLNTNCPSLMFAGIDWQQLALANPKIKDVPRLAGLLTGHAAGGTRIRSELAALPRERWSQLLIEFIRGEVAKVLQVEPEQVSTEQSLTEIGLDSLSSFELMHRLEAELGLAIPVTKFLQTPTLVGLASLVATTLETSLADEDGTTDESTHEIDATKPASSRHGGLQALPIQRLALEWYGARMTSDWGRAGLVFSLSRPLPDTLDIAELQERYARIATQHDALRLSIAGNGKPGLSLMDSPPVFEHPISPALPALQPGRALWRAGVRYDASGQPMLTLICHAAAGDRYSLQYLAARLLATDEVQEPSPINLATISKTRAALADTPEWRQHAAYWSELLHNCPSALDFGVRRRAPAPLGLGLNHGPAQVIQFELPMLTDTTDALQREALLLAAYACTISDTVDQSRILIERFETRRPVSLESVIGPLQSSLLLPCDLTHRQTDRLLNRFTRLLQQCLTHREFDAAHCLTAFSDAIRANGSLPTQVGFAYHESDALSEQPLAALDSAVQADVDQAGCRHDLLLTVQASDARLIAQLRYDSAVFDNDPAQRLADALRQTIMRFTTANEERLVGISGTLKNVPLSPVFEIEQSAATEATIETGHVPLSIQQIHLLNRLSESSVTADYQRYWWLNRALLIEPGFDLDRLQRTFIRIVERHESLRMRFEHQDDTWRAIIDEQHRTDIMIHDVGEVDDDALLSLLQRECDQSPDIERTPLLQVTLYRCGGKGDALLFRIHHLVIDGWSHAYLLDEILQAYLGLELPPYQGLTHRQYLELLQGVGNTETIRRRTEFWHRRLLPPFAMPELGRIAKGGKPNTNLTDGGPMGQITLPMTESGTASITERARRVGVTETALLIAAFASVIAEEGQVDSLYIAVPMAARSDARLRDFVGWVSSLATLRCEVRRHETVDQMAVDVMRQLLESEGNLPDALATYNAPLPDELQRTGAHPRQFFVSMLVPEGLAKISPLADAFYGTGGRVIEFGGVKIRSLSLDERKGIIPEIDLRSFKMDDRLHYQASYDTTAFTVHEVRHLLTQTCQRMGIPPDQQECIIISKRSEESVRCAK